MRASRRGRLDTKKQRRQREIDQNFYKDSFIPENMRVKQPKVDFIATSNGDALDIRNLTGRALRGAQGKERELRVAEISGGRLTGIYRGMRADGTPIIEDEPIIRNGRVVTAIDVYGKNGELIQVRMPLCHTILVEPEVTMVSQFTKMID